MQVHVPAGSQHYPDPVAADLLERFWGYRKWCHWLCGPVFCAGAVHAHRLMHRLLSNRTSYQHAKRSPRRDMHGVSKRAATSMRVLLCKQCLIPNLHGLSSSQRLHSCICAKHCPNAKVVSSLLARPLHAWFSCRHVTRWMAASASHP